MFKRSKNYLHITGCTTLTQREGVMEKPKQTIYIFTSFITEKVSEKGHHIPPPPHCGGSVLLPAYCTEDKGETLDINYKITWHFPWWSESVTRFVAGCFFRNRVIKRVWKVAKSQSWLQWHSLSFSKSCMDIEYLIFTFCFIYSKEDLLIATVRLGSWDPLNHQDF